MNLEEIKLKITKFVKEELYPLEPWILNCEWDEKLPKLNELRDKVKAQGLWLPQIPKDYGGLGLTNAQHGEVSEILGASPYGHYVFNCQAPDAGNMEILIEFGTKEQKEKYLEPLLKGETRSCFAMTEPDFAGSNPVNMGTTAVIKENNYIKAWDKKLIHKNLKNIRIPESTIEAYKLQADYKTYSKHNLFGWKIAATSIEGQKHIGVDGPIAGRLIKERLHRSGDRISLKNNQMKVVEAEFSFKLNKDMQKKNTPYLYEEVLEYIEHICPAIEIPDSRFLNFNKIVLKYKQNDFSFWVNGFEVATITSGNTPSGLSQLQFADSDNTVSTFYGRTKEVAVFKTALTDSELESLSSWDSFSDMATGQEYSIR